jgi:hypothetical protein
MLDIKTILQDVNVKYYKQSGNLALSRQIRILAEVLVEEINKELDKKKDEEGVYV